MKRTERITFRVTKRELEIINRKANKSNLSLSQYIRYVSTNKKILVVEGLEEFNKELRAIGKNINQLTRLCNQGYLTCIGLKDTKNKLNQLISKVSMLGVK